MVAALVQKIISLFVVLFAGYLLVKLGIIKAHESKTISMLVVYLVIPCTIISAFQIDRTAELQAGLLLTLGAGLMIQLVNMAVLYALKKPLRLDPVELCSAMYPNSGNLIIPLVSAMLGPEWIVFTCTFTCVQIIFIWTHCKTVISSQRSLELRKILLNSNMISIYLGIIVFVFGIRFPAPIKDAMDSVASMVGPLSMLVIGIIIGTMDIKQVFTYKRVWLVTGLKLILLPLIILGCMAVLLSIVDIPDEKTILMISMLQASAPSAAFITQLAQLYGGDEHYCSAINVVSTLMCMFTMPLIIALYELI